MPSATIVAATCPALPFHCMQATADPRPIPMITARGEFTTGLRLIAPVLPGTAAWGLVSGVAMLKTGLDPWQAIGMTLLMYAGSAQLACLPLLAAHAPVGVMLLSAGVINLRFIIYGLGLAPAFRRESTMQKLFLGYLNADPAYALFVPRRDEEPDRPHGRALYLGLAVGNWTVWQLSSLIGVVLAAQVPTAWGLELAGVLALLALAIPLIATLPALAGALAASLVGAFTIGWPLRLGIIAAVVAGVAVAMASELVVPPKRVREASP